MAPRFWDLPIVLAPLGGVATVDLIIAVANARGFAILPCAYLTPEQITEQIGAVRRATTRPFGVNLFVETPPYVATPQELAAAHDRLGAYRKELGIPHSALPSPPPDRYHAQIAAILSAKPDVLTFTFGIPDATILEQCLAAGILTMGTATTVAEAKALEFAGVDGIIAQGAEAGAHRGTFLAPVDQSLIGTLALVPQIVDATPLPVFAAGGIGDGRAVAAVLALGASAAVLGTSFLLAAECGTASAYREALESERALNTALTRVFSGRVARGIRNRPMTEILDPEEIAPYPFQNAMTRDIRAAAAEQGRAEFLSLWAGQAAIFAKAKPAADIVAELMAECRQSAQRLSSALVTTA